MRQPSEIMRNGASLAAILEQHREWLMGSGGARADLADASLARANLARANLARANLAGAYLARANLADAYLARANLADAYLGGADLADASLANADLARANLARANLAGAYLANANLGGAYLGNADLANADLADARGNMREVKSAQFALWGVTWTTAPDGTVTLQIGCQRHPIDMWRRADPRWIAAMDGRAPGWWSQYGAIVLALVDASPAKPWGMPVASDATIDGSAA
jgi:uncharacterized protein YjbI with pentapeptide repeats